ncbi:hypothetical protein DSB74_26975, partial [Salmonella enterica subsp. enterica serovar Typhimurium]|uniref:hypothetical protein n=1 Tax=Salmonella enterica TaxID=28901 RepID=UPI001156E076
SESYAISTETGGIVDGSSGGRFVIDGDIRAAGATAASGTLPQYQAARVSLTQNTARELLQAKADAVSAPLLNIAGTVDPLADLR